MIHHKVLLLCWWFKPPAAYANTLGIVNITNYHVSEVPNNNSYCFPCIVSVE